MKLLQIDVNYGKSSTGKIVKEIHEYSSANGIESYVLYGRGKKSKNNNVFKFAYDFETVMHAFLTRITGFTGFFSYFSTRRLIKKIKKINPDVIHIHELHAYFVNYGKLIKYIKKHDIKTVWTFHCEFMYTGKCGHSFDDRPQKTKCGTCESIKEYPKSLFFDFTKQMYEHKKRLFDNFNNLTIVTPSQWLKNRVANSFLHDKNIIVINNGIDTNFFSLNSNNELKRKHKITNERIVLSVAPNLMSKGKGGKHVIEIAKNLINEDVVFIMIGNEIDLIDPPPNIIPLGPIYDEKTLSMYYNIADYFLITSERETYPTTCLEAVISGTPIIGFNTGGVSETAPKGIGKFVDYKDICSIVKILRNELNGESVFLSSEKIREYGIRHHTKEKMLKKYLDLYITK